MVLSLIVTPSLYDLGERLAPRLNSFPPARWLTTSNLREVPVPVQEPPSSAPAAAGADANAAAQPSAGSEAKEPHGSAAHAAAAHGASGHKAPRSAIIAGFGIVGRAVADHLEVHGVPYTVVEINAATIQTQRSLGRRVVFGDIANPEVLESAGVHDADAVFLTIPDDEATLRACQTIRRLAPHTFIVARAAFLSTAFQAAASGADDVAVAEVATAEAMAKKVLARL
ncbi:MAG: NAD-binding protein, partial [Phycisphaerales bacterium]